MAERSFDAADGPMAIDACHALQPSPFKEMRELVQEVFDTYDEHEIPLRASWVERAKAALGIK